MQRAAVSPSGTAALRRSAGRTFLRLDHNNFKFLDAVVGLGVAQGIVISRAHLPAQRESPAGDHRDLVSVADSNRFDWILDCATAGAADPRVVTADGDKHRAWAELKDLRLPIPTHRLADPVLCRELADQFADLQESSRYLSAPYFELKSHRHGALDWNTRMLDILGPASPDRPLVAFIQTTLGRARKGLFSRVAREYSNAGASFVVLRVRGLTHRTATGDDVHALLAAARAFQRLGIDVMFDCTGRLGAVLAAVSEMAYSTGAHNFRGLSGSILGSSGGVGSRVTYEAPTGLNEHHPDSIAARQAMPDATPSQLKLHRLQVYDGVSRMHLEEILHWLRGSSSQHRGWADAIVLAQRLSA
jgi:hypothetical protein